jgi:hypothetical protein
MKNESLDFGLFPGVTLRDWFAGTAMALIHEAAVANNTEASAEWIAKHAYIMADAMLKERKWR